MTASAPRPDRGQRGFELDAHVTLSRPRTAGEVETLLRGFGAAVEPYGTDEVRSARVSGQVSPELAREQLRALIESGEAARIELGLRGFLRSATGQTEWMPWRRNVVLARGQWQDVKFEEGLRYVLE
ncbi:hypothetical protein DKM44_04375 [Deinococcus irradiatisoli]|uniref:Uncharacterized protein n=1 Tax=Deinococcus irradiatisoli TaxID=2202254 RepID=A0A2Z3JGE3_9DEIO|nr:hypothetical protein [Deinococcus irradiatisoli]AWN22561.1 hypothetical protein DKM44_04375 [Deinococcus irradiatisoli]